MLCEHMELQGSLTLLTVVCLILYERKGKERDTGRAMFPRGDVCCCRIVGVPPDLSEIREVGVRHGSAMT